MLYRLKPNDKLSCLYDQQYAYDFKEDIPIYSVPSKMKTKSLLKRNLTEPNYPPIANHFGSTLSGFVDRTH